MVDPKAIDDANATAATSRATLGARKEASEYTKNRLLDWFYEAISVVSTPVDGEGSVIWPNV